MVVALLLALAAASLRAMEVQDPDTAWQLKATGDAWAAGHFRYIDQTSFVVPDQAFVHTQWLAGLFMWALHGALGWAGVVAFAMFCAALAAAGAFFLLRYLGADEGRAAVCTMLWVGAASWAFEPRPRALYLALVPWALMLAEAYHRSTAPSARRRWTGLLLLLQLLWAHIHPSYVIFPALLGLSSLRKRVWTSPRAVQSVVLLTVSMALVGLLGPRGIDGLGFAASVGGADQARFIGEMRALSWSDLWPGRHADILWLDVLVVVAALRSFRYRRMRLRDVSLALLGFLLCLIHHRFTALWGILLLPWVVRRYETKRRWFRSPDAPRASLFASVAATLIFALSFQFVRQEAPARRIAFQANFDVYPEALAQFLRGRGATGRLLNGYDDGGYLAYRLAPDVRMAIDGRALNFYDNETFYFVRQARQRAEAFRAFARRHRPTLVSTEPGAPLCRALADDKDWRPAYLDHRRVLFYRVAAYPEWRGFRVLDACRPQASIHERCPGPAGAALLDEVEAFRSEAPTVALAHALSGHAHLACRQDQAEAARAAEAVLATASHAPGVLSMAADLFAASGDFLRALDVADLAVTVGGGPSLRMLRADLARRAGNWSRAAEDYRWGIDRMGDAAPPEWRVAQAEVLWALGRPEEARRAARRAIRTGAVVPSDRPPFDEAVGALRRAAPSPSSEGTSGR